MSCVEQVSYVPCGCKAHIHEKDFRASIWRAALGCLEFPLQNPIYHMGEAQGEKPARFLKGDWRALSEEQKHKIFIAIRHKFSVNIEIFRKQIEALGYMPIKDENITVEICGLHQRCMQ